MPDIVNLRTIRKRAGKRDAQQRAAENRALFGQTKAEKTLSEARKAKDSSALDQHRLHKGDSE